MLKLSQNPAILTPQVRSLTELNGTWWAAYTKSRFEKVFAWDMQKRGIGYFLPMREKITFSGGRKRKVLVPLFTSYVFICGTEMDRYNAMATNRLCQMIDVYDQELLISELASIERSLLNKAIIDVYPNLVAGSHVRITSGPMMGIEGVVIKRKDEKARMVLKVTMLGQGALIEIDADLIETIN